MTSLLTLAARSAWNRRFALSLVVASIALSTLLLLGIERLRQDMRASFSQAVSGTDLIVGPRTGNVQLLLYAVFHLGTPTSAIRMASLDALARHRMVAWVEPLALGDSHRGFAVLGTQPSYFEHLRYGGKQKLALASGRLAAAGTPAGLFETVIGWDVAQRLGDTPGAKVVIAHGDGAMEHNDHDDKPFTVVGVLAPTGTPVDRTLHIPLEAVEAIHLDWAGGAPPAPGQKTSAEDAAKADLHPRTATAALVGLKSRAAVFAVQRDVAALRDEPLLAILPNVALDELWTVVGLGERGLQAAAVLVALVSLAGLVAVIAAGLNERRRELAILRAVGAAPRQVWALLALEGGIVTATGVALGVATCWLATRALAPWAQAHYGIVLGAADAGADGNAASGAEWALVGAVLAGGWLASLLPGWRAYRLSLSDGLSPRI